MSYSEEKVVRISQVVYPPLKSLERSSKALACLREEMTAEVCSFYADEFSVFSSGSVRLEAGEP